MIWDFKNFKEEEFHCKCCGRFPLMADENYRGLVFYFLQPLRTHIGKPIHITSGYRCPKHNREISGAARSYHTIPDKPTIYHPCAIDFFIEGLSISQAGAYAREHTNLSFCGFHIYTRYDDTWLCHIDWRGVKARW